MHRCELKLKLKLTFSFHFLRQFNGMVSGFGVYYCDICTLFVFYSLAVGRCCNNNIYVHLHCMCLYLVSISRVILQRRCNWCNKLIFSEAEKTYTPKNSLKIDIVIHKVNMHLANFEIIIITCECRRRLNNLTFQHRDIYGY